MTLFGKVTIFSIFNLNSLQNIFLFCTFLWQYFKSFLILEYILVKLSKIHHYLFCTFQPFNGRTIQTGVNLSEYQNLAATFFPKLKTV